MRWLVKTGFVYLRPATLVAIRANGPYHTAAASAWKRMFDWMATYRLRGRIKLGYGLAHDDPRVTPAAKCRYDACIEAPDYLPAAAYAGVMPAKLPGGPYARLRCVGPHSELGVMARRLRDEWTGKHGLELCSIRPMIEIYLDDPATCEPTRLRTDICLPIAFGSARSVA